MESDINNQEQTEANPQSHLLLVTALQAEATPLIEHYRLKAQHSRAYRLYQSGQVTLIVCGIGELAASSATSFALGLVPHNCVAINVGIAGSDNAIGKIFQASSIAKLNLHNHSNHPQGIFYPHLPFKSEITKLATLTVDEPCTDYRSDCCYEMEAYGFCFAARQFLPAELVHCLKIVSDNPTTPVSRTSGKNKFSLAGENIRQLVQANLQLIDTFASQLAESTQPGIAASVQPHHLLKMRNEFIADIENQTNNKLHFTISQQEQLSKLIRRYAVLERELPKDLPNNSSSELIKALNTRINEQLPHYSTP